jgi:Putative endonuclease, protein of unknown function (DUF1780)
MNTFDEDYLKKLQNHAGETRTFFSNNMKVERERSVVRAFLRSIGVSFEDNELVAPSTEPVDVAFRTARFQNRDLLRHKPGYDWKQKYNNVSCVKQLLEPYSPPKPFSLTNLVLDVSDALSKKAEKYPKKYPNGCRDIDALVYVSLKNEYLRIDSQLLNITTLKCQGWRSVSILFPPYGIVLTAEEDAPDFLKSIEREPQNTWENPSTIFEI